MKSLALLHPTFTSFMRGVGSQGYGTGTWTSEQPQMTLIYRDKKYVQLQVVGFDPSTKTSLTYRGVSYAK